jgi:hypothetical protein
MTECPDRLPDPDDGACGFDLSRGKDGQQLLLDGAPVNGWSSPRRIGWTHAASSDTLSRVRYVFGSSALILLAALASVSLAGQAGGERLSVFGDTVLFYPPGHPRNCLLNNQFKRGEPVGFRMSALNAATGKRDRATELVVHLTYAGKTVDIPMRDRQNEKQPEREFWVAKWVVPDDAPMGIVRYTVTAKDPQGRTGEFKPFEVQASQITIVP